VPGITVARYDSEGVLYAGIKERHSLSLVEEGWSEWWFEGRTYRTGPGSLLARWRGGVHRDLRREGRSRFQVVTLAPELVGEVRQAMGLGAGEGGPAVVAPSRPEAAALRRLHEVFREEPDERLAAEEAAAEALAALAAVLSGDGAPDAPRRFRREVLRARALIEATSAESLGLAHISAHAGLDRFHLCRAFREEVGLPPHAYRTHLRVARARGLLARGLSPGAVAAEVGFSDQSQLTRHFRRIVGLAPGAYGRAVAPGNFERRWRREPV
jgi:AraC-like DNA-binding protein